MRHETKEIGQTLIREYACHSSAAADQRKRAEGPHPLRSVAGNSSQIGPARNKHNDLPPRGNSDAELSSQRQVVESILVIHSISALLFLVLSRAQATDRLVCTYVGVTHLVVGLTVFTLHGKSVVTPLGVFSLLSGVFAGAAVPLGFEYGFVIDGFTTVWITLLHLTFLTIVIPAASVPVAQRGRTVSASKSSIVVGLGLTSAGAGLSPFRSALGPIPSGVFVAGVVLVAISLSAFLQRRVSHYVFFAATAVAAFAGFDVFFFEKNGRIQLGSLSIVFLMSLSAFKPQKLQKLGVLLAIPAFLIWGGLLRGTPSNSTTSSSREAVVLDGLSSAYGPLFDGARLFRADHNSRGRDAAFPRQFGQTFLESTFTWVPRAVWPGKPKGFGARLTEVLEPELVKDGHSMAALAQGEWYVNFGLAGLALFAFSTSFGLIRLQTWWNKKRSPSLTQSVIYVLSVTSLTDYLWMGTFSVMARTGLSAAVLVIACKFMKSEMPDLSSTSSGLTTR